MAGEKNIIKVFLVDDHPLVLSGLKSELQKVSHIELAGEALSGEEALEKIPKVLPDVILMDIGMPGISGLEATVMIKKKIPGARIIALTMHNNKDYVFEAIRLGAMGYVMKDAPPDELIQAIETVYDDSPYYSSSIQKLILKHHADILRKSKKSFVEESLTSREFDVLVLLVTGLSNKQIAEKLFLSVRTVESHREHIMKKLDIKSIAGLTKYAISQGLIEV